MQSTTPTPFPWPALVLLAISAVLLSLRPTSSTALVLTCASALLLLLWLVHPASYGQLHRFIQSLALGVATTLSLLAMAIVYFMVLTPIAITMRGFGRDPLATGCAAATATSHWQPPPKQSYNEDFFKAQF